ncbi:hypothetical protein EJ05DRAFT_497566 [Pseudovirgaria hyperparasitica]|uniref:Zn(2)-C6 fungal-type domain-containing protein n=1 Tax=Pseudovirgaria hyperparasitica TaxID=470096 RepID=A0A6A6WGB7_9PEZI|nr:uncharacterized protein EJ05DRAFT_497566 [Pseudovirgaria hyperparasitica]KAF2760996.1 hypothetical protein EJ05DRAFT_497566 [Pseudovirgaria hyperparasitica]
MSMQTMMTSDAQLRAIEKQFKFRVRTGCKTCRARRVKCDEGKPSCNRCWSSGRTCAGYDIAQLSPAAAAATQRNSSFLVIPQRPNSTTASFRTDSRGRKSNPLLPVSRSPSLSPFRNDAEARSFEFFREYTLQNALGHFDTDFWKRRVLQMCHDEPSIRYGILALSSLHEHWNGKLGLPRGEKGAFALAQYAQAIKSSNALLSRRSKDREHLERVLVACIIFVCYENLVGNYNLSAMHLKNGLRILSENRILKAHPDKKASIDAFSTDDAEESELANLFSLLDLQAMTFSDESCEYNFESFSGPLLLSIPPVFSSLTQARNTLTLIFRQMCYAAYLEDRDMRTPSVDKIRPEGVFSTLEVHCMTAIEQWMRSFTNLRYTLLSNPSVDPTTISAITRVAIWGLTTQSIIKSWFFEHTRFIDCWDSSFDLLKTALDLIETLPGNTDHTPADALPRYNTAAVSFIPIPSISLQAAVFHCTHRMRDPYHRRRGIRYLLQRRVRDGVWDSFGEARVAAEIIKFEEGLPEDYDLCQDILDNGLEGCRMGVSCKEEVPQERHVLNVHTKVFIAESRVEYRFLKTDMTYTERRNVYFYGKDSRNRA